MLYEVITVDRHRVVVTVVVAGDDVEVLRAVPELVVAVAFELDEVDGAGVVELLFSYNFV